MPVDPSEMVEPSARHPFSTCYDHSMPARAFKIDRLPPRPPSVEKTAEKYGVSKSALNEIKAFVAGFVSGAEEPGLTRWKVSRSSRFTVPPAARRASERRGSAHRKAGPRKFKTVRKAAGRKK